MRESQREKRERERRETLRERDGQKRQRDSEESYLGHRGQNIRGTYK
jgi:hypothetical protein